MSDDPARRRHSNRRRNELLDARSVHTAYKPPIRARVFCRGPTPKEIQMSCHIDPERDQFEAFKALPRDEPVMMLNLLRFRAKALYGDGRNVTGAEAYAAYGRDSAPVFQRVGGEIVWRGRPEVTLIGPADERWDLAFVARYPTAGAFLEMVTDPDYREAVRHRQAAVLDSRLIGTTAAAAGQGFAIPQ